MAGPTAGAADRSATTATRLTWPDMAATSGVQASCAASGTATASATQRGSQRQPVAPPGREPEDAGGGQRREGEPERHRQPRVEAAAAHGCASARVPRARPWCPCRPGRPNPSPRPGRRSARCGRAARTDHAEGADHHQTARAYAGPAGEQEQRTDHERQVGAGDRQQMGEPRGTEGVGEVLGHPPSSPSTRAGTRARAVRLVRDRVADRAAQVVRSAEQGPGRATTSGGPRVLSTPARSLVRPAAAARSRAAVSRGRGAASARRRSPAPARGPGGAGRAR